MISLHHAETDNTNTPLTDNESANAETFPYNETEKVTAVLKGGGGGGGEKKTLYKKKKKIKKKKNKKK